MTFPRINPHFCRNRFALHLAYSWVSQKIWWPTLVQQPLPWKYGEIWNQFKPRKPSEMSVIILSKFDCHLPNSQFRRKTSADWRPICFFSQMISCANIQWSCYAPRLFARSPTSCGKFQTRSSPGEKTLQCSIIHIPKKNQAKRGGLDNSECHVVEIVSSMYYIYLHSFIFMYIRQKSCDAIKIGVLFTIFCWGQRQRPNINWNLKSVGPGSSPRTSHEILVVKKWCWSNFT